jgi:putative transposase
MNKDAVIQDKSHSTNPSKDPLEDILRNGARKLLQQAIEQEVEDYINEHRSLKDNTNKRVVIRNGHLPERAIMTGIGPIEVQQPRVRDSREGPRFTSAILPKYARKAPSVESVIPALYLKGISSNDFSEALEALLGVNAKGLSSSTIYRLKEVWKQEYKEWSERRLSEKHYVYVWADGVHFNVRLTDDRPCILVLIGALPSGKKEIIGILDGQRESTLSWKDLLLSLKQKGLNTAPSLAIGDGALGFWKALEEVFPGTRQQRCWVHIVL